MNPLKELRKKADELTAVLAGQHDAYLRNTVGTPTSIETPYPERCGAAGAIAKAMHHLLDHAGVER